MQSQKKLPIRNETQNSLYVVRKQRKKMVKLKNDAYKKYNNMEIISEVS